MKNTFFAYTPFTGLGMYGGYRGDRWLRNRIKIFKQFVLPAMMAQTDRDFIHWISWRPEEKTNPIVRDLFVYMKTLPGYQFIFTFSGIAFWDDKLPDGEAHKKLDTSLRDTLPALHAFVPEAETDIMLLVPSDDIYETTAVHDFKHRFDNTKDQAISYRRGYLCNYYTKELLEYNPKTNPPFFAIKFPAAAFFDAEKHMEHTGAYKSHEYIGDKLKMGYFESRGFIVGTHGENISTHFNNPFGGDKIPTESLPDIYKQFAMSDTPGLVLPKSVRKWVMRRLPHKWQRKFRYWFGEKLFDRFYKFIRN